MDFRHVSAAVFALIAAGANAQSFSCTFGRATCLDYGDKVCSQFGKCVDDNAICFEQFTCNYAGFVCKSDYDELVREYEGVVRRHDELLGDCRDMADDHDTLVYRYNSLLDSYEDVRAELGDVTDELHEVKDCVDFATSLNEAKSCY